MSDEQFALLLSEIRGLRAELRRRESAIDLEVAWRVEIGPQPMTTAGVVALIEDDPHSTVADALARLVDLSSTGRLVSIGRLLGAQAWLAKDPCGPRMQFRLRD